MKESLLYKNFKNDIVQCMACNHYCAIKKGGAGKCGVRKNVNGALELLVYGKPFAAHIDPIEKKPLYHFLPGTQIFSIGTLGCNFSCDFCQNWQMSQTPKKDTAILDELEKIIDAESERSPEQIVECAKTNHIPSIAYTYNEPTVFFEYAYDTGMLARKNGIKNVFVSNGFMTKESNALWGEMLDAINIDLKSFSEKFYEKRCGARLAPVLENIERFKKAGVWVEVTTLLIPGENDTKEELKAIADFLAAVDKEMPWHISRFHPDHLMLDHKATSEKALLHAYETGKSAGLSHVYIGNWAHETYDSTYCPSCGRCVIARHGYTLVNELKNGACPACGRMVAGVWHVS